MCNPEEAQEKLDSYRADTKNLVDEVLKARLKGFGAIATLVFFLSFAAYETFGVYGVGGWFPGWPGLDRLPFSLFDPETGLSALPRYFFSDDPATLM